MSGEGMTDPAAEAAHRVAVSAHMISAPLIATLAAREALKPIQEMHQWWMTENCMPPQAYQILYELAPLIYSSEELDR